MKDCDNVKMEEEWTEREVNMKTGGNRNGELSGE